MILIERAAGAKFLYRTCRLCWFSNRNMGSNISRNTFEPSNALLGTLSSLGGPRRLPEFGGPLRHSPPIWGPPLTFSLQFGGPSLGPDLGAPLPFSKNFGGPRGPGGPQLGALCGSLLSSYGIAHWQISKQHYYILRKGSRSYVSDDPNDWTVSWTWVILIFSNFNAWPVNGNRMSLGQQMCYQ